MQVMLADIEACSDLGVDGVVIGCLQPDGAVDVAATQQLVHKAKQHVGWQFACCSPKTATMASRCTSPLTCWAVLWLSC